MSTTTMVLAKVTPHRSKLSRLTGGKHHNGGHDNEEQVLIDSKNKSKSELSHRRGREREMINKISRGALVGLTCRWTPLCRTPWGTSRLPPGSLLQVCIRQKQTDLRFPPVVIYNVPRRGAKVPTETEPPHSA